MALIVCPECGKEFSDRAPACPNCGCPTDEILKDMHSEDETHEETDEQSNQSNESADGIKNTAENILNSFRSEYHATSKISVVQIDKNNRKFRIRGAAPASAKKGGLLRGAMAISTMGMSLAAEKALGMGKKKVGTKEWFGFDDLVNYDLIEDDSLVTSGGVGQALIGGALFGGFGAVAGGITGKRTQKRKVESLYIKVTLNTFDCPCVMVPLITKSTKTNSKEYKEAFDEAHQILSALDVITHNA